VCGINGAFAYHYAANAVDACELIATRDHMAARGPDAKGLWMSRDAAVGLGHRRLSIIDITESGAQPMANADQSLIVTFNGEIYNYRSLRQGLEARGYRFRSQSDTEVLLQLYADKGEAMVHDLRGMFAFAIWDVAKRKLVLARDPFGIKPLYYADDGWTFRFASQVKALLAGGKVSRDPDPAGAAGFYLLGSVPEPFTTFAAIRALPAGTMMLVDRTGAGQVKRYHSIASVYREAEARPFTDGDAVAEVRAALLDSVKSHLVADVPVGAFLSAGIDSGALVGLMCDAGARDIETVTIAFEEFSGAAQDEAPLAQQVAAHYGTRHTTRVVTRAEFEQDLPRILEAMDQPSIDGINTWFVSKAASERGLKVAVSGLGGDELFGGYPSFADIPKWVKFMSLPSRAPGLGALARLAMAPLVERFSVSPKAAGMLELGGTYAGAWLLKRGLFLPRELREALDPDMIREGLRRLAPLQLINEAITPLPRSAFARVATLEATFYMRNQLLRDADWASMAHSLEVRVPLVDSVLLQNVAAITCARALDGKRLLAAAPGRALPAEVLARKKTGFTTPVQSWMRALVGNAGEGTGPWAREWAKYVGRRMLVRSNAPAR